MMIIAPVTISAAPASRFPVSLSENTRVPKITIKKNAQTFDCNDIRNYLQGICHVNGGCLYGNNGTDQGCRWQIHPIV